MVFSMGSPVALAFVAATMLTVLSMDVAAKLYTHNLQRAFSEIEVYLEKHTSSDLVEVNMQAVENCIADNKECYFYNEGVNLEALQLLATLKAKTSDLARCGTNEVHELLMQCDKGLDTEYRRETPNYRVTKLEKIIGHYAKQYVRSCGISGQFPALEISFKQRAYDQIDEWLEQALPGNSDVEANLAEAKKVLSKLEDKQGALSQALIQLLAMQKANIDYNCDHGIILDNDLATRGQGHNHRYQPKRRVDKIVFHYSALKAQQCRGILPALYRFELQTIPGLYYRDILALSSFFFLDGRSNEIVSSANEREVSEDFTITPIVKYAQALVLSDSRKRYALESDASISHVIMDYIEGKRGFSTRATIVDQETSEKVVKREAVKELLEEFVTVPCAEYLAAVGRWVQIDLYNAEVVPDYLTSDKEQFIEELPNYMIRAGYQICKYAQIRSDSIITNVYRLVRNVIH